MKNQHVPSFLPLDDDLKELTMHSLPRLSQRELPIADFVALGASDGWSPDSLPVVYAEWRDERDNSRFHHFALKIVVHARETDESTRMTVELCREAAFYSLHLSKSQGKFVPVHYGIWVGRSKWGGNMVCAIMDWCGVSYTKYIHTSSRDSVKLR
jgi:hypothetical protein